GLVRERDPPRRAQCRGAWGTCFQKIEHGCGRVAHATDAKVERAEGLSIERELRMPRIQRLRQQACARVHGTDRWRRRAGQSAQLDHRAGQCLDLDRPPLLDVLQHRSLVRTDFLRTRNSTLDADTEVDAELLRDRLGLGHHLRRQIAGERKLTDVHQGGVRQRADRIETQVAPELEPDLAAQVFCYRRFETRLGETRGQSFDARRGRAIELTERETVPLDELNHSLNDAACTQIYTLSLHDDPTG